MTIHQSLQCVLCSVLINYRLNDISSVPASMHVLDGIQDRIGFLHIGSCDHLCQRLLPGGESYILLSEQFVGQ